jgi:hypothetical protein
VGSFCTLQLKIFLLQNEAVLPKVFLNQEELLNSMKTEGCISLLQVLDFKLSPCSACSMLSSG